MILFICIIEFFDLEGCDQSSESLRRCAHIEMQDIALAGMPCDNQSFVACIICGVVVDDTECVTGRAAHGIACNDCAGGSFDDISQRIIRLQPPP